MTAFFAQVEAATGRRFSRTDDAAWRWSVDEPDAFWGAVVAFFDLPIHDLPTPLLADPSMPGAVWFPGASLNYAEHVLRPGLSAPDRTALIAVGEGGEPERYRWAELRRQVGSMAAALRRLGVGRGDRVVGTCRTSRPPSWACLRRPVSARSGRRAAPTSGRPVSSTGSARSTRSCWSPSTATATAVAWWTGGQSVADLRRSLPTVRAHGAGAGRRDPQARPEATLLFDDLVAGDEPPEFERVPFDHPLWVLYSSGTTGLPKAIVQGHGGIVLEHLKYTRLHADLGPGSVFFWYTSTSWMVWNFLVGGLMTGATSVLYDGSPVWPDVTAQWALAERLGVTLHGTSAAYLIACAKSRVRPGDRYDLSVLRSLNSTGSPLPASGFRWVYEAVEPDVWLASMSGGTDVCTAFAGGHPMLPVREGELQCRSLGGAAATPGTPTAGR